MPETPAIIYTSAQFLIAWGSTLVSRRYDRPRWSCKKSEGKIRRWCWWWIAFISQGSSRPHVIWFSDKMFGFPLIMLLWPVAIERAGGRVLQIRMDEIGLSRHSSLPLLCTEPSVSRHGVWPGDSELDSFRTSFLRGWENYLDFSATSTINYSFYLLELHLVVHRQFRDLCSESASCAYC